ncbi:MAG: aldo/keto reductase [Clostridiales bacterium]|nr:aldo/keto reductase [Clostridiales bacterium]
MEYRELSGTGLDVSIIGMGGEHLDGKPYEQVKETVDAALEHGVNIIDVFMPGEEIRANIAKALGDRRKDVIIQGHIGSTDVKQQYDVSRDLPTVKKYFEGLLRIFGYIDIGMMFFIDSEKDYKDVFETGFVEYVQRLKEQGDIRHIGFGSHNPDTAVKVINTGIPEMMMFSINPAFDMLPTGEYIIDQLDKGFKPELFRGIDPKRLELYKLCKQKQVGITVMKTYCAGKLLSADLSPFNEPLTPVQCIHYALSRPSVASVLVGLKTREEVLAAMAYLDADAAEKDYTEVISSVKSDFRGSCVYCSHCQPCPAGIDIAEVNKCLDIARLDTGGIPDSVSAGYKGLAHGGGECIACGNCEERCPFGVHIIDNMKEAEKLLG